MRTKRKKELFSVLLMLILIGITVGYAALSVTLDITGSSQIKNNTWDIHFNNVVINPDSVTLSTGDSAATINPNNNTEVTYSVTLQKPGDFYEFTVDAVNAGTVNGMIGAVVSKLNGTVIDAEHPLPVYLDYSITYSDGVEIIDNHLLEAGHTETYRVRLEFKKDISNDQLPAADVTPSLSVGVGFIQASNAAIPVHHPITGTRYAFNPSSKPVYIGSAVPDGVVLYETYQEIFALKPTAKYFIKHVIVNDIVTETYVALMSGNTPYYFRGGIDESALAERPIFNANATVFHHFVDEQDCLESSNSHYGDYDHMRLYLFASGIIEIDDAGIGCYAYSDGSSYCY